MKIVFMGTPDFAVNSLAALLQDKNIEVVAVVTQPDKPKGRGKKFLPTPVKKFALEQGLPVYQPEKVREADFVEVLEKYAPDFIVVAAYGQFLPEKILNLPRYACVNVHASLLPRYRGAAPIQYAIVKGEKESGVTIMHMEKGMDTGAMYSKVVVPITEEMSFEELHDELAEKGAALLLETLPKIAEGLEPEVQNEEEATYATLLTKEMAEIDWSKSAQEVHDLIRGFDPVPGAFTYLPDGRLLKIWETRVLDEAADAPCGSVTGVTKKNFTVACGDKKLCIKSLQPAGKKRMDTAGFLNGNKLEPGEVLGKKA